MSIQLKENKEYLYGEIASFFNIRLDAFIRNKDFYLEKLKEFAIFEENHSKIIIKQVIAAFNLGTLEERKQFKKFMFQEIKNNNVNELLLAKNLKKKYEFFKEYSLKEILYKIRYYLTEYYGNSFEGLKGKKIFQFLKIDNNKELKELNEIENERKDKVIKQWFGNITENVLLIEDMLNNKEIEKEECWDLLEKICSLNSFEEFKKALNIETAANLINGYKIIDRKEYEIEIDDNDIDDSEFSKEIY